MIAITFRLEFCKMDLQENELKQEESSYFCQIALVGRVGAIVEAKSFILLAERINLNAAKWIYMKINLGRKMVHISSRAHW